MRKFSLVPVFVGLLFHASYAQETNHYVVVGAFGVMENATRFANKISKTGFKAQHSVNPAKDLYYVYLYRSTSLEQAYAYLMRVRVETPYKDAWIYHGRLGSEPVVTIPVQRPEIKEETPAPAPVEPEKPTVQETAVVTTEEITEPKNDPVPPKPAGKPFFFKLVSEATGSPVTGEVQVLESTKSNEYIAYESNKIVYLPPPKNKNGTFQLVTLAPGYKASKRSISYIDPANSAAAIGPSSEFVIAVPLIRVQQGDYIEFSNVRFYPNTVLLQPESRLELGGLVSLLNENSAYKVTIHGHCNGNEARDITTLGTSTDFFATNTGNVRENADAKRLTLLRAETVKAYLVQQGIDAERIKTKGEGGKQYIYPTNSTLSARNDRIEVEIKKGK